MEKSFATVSKMVGVFFVALLVGGAFFHKNLQGTMADLLSRATLTDEEREVLKDPAAANKASYEKMMNSEAYERSQAIQRQFNGNQTWKPPVVNTHFQPPSPPSPGGWNRGWKK
jgi:hypothetical protein